MNADRRDATPTARGARGLRASARLGALALVAALDFGCTIIVQPKPPPGGGGGLPVPLTCSVAETPTAHVFFAMRVERSTVNLAPRYASMMQTSVAAITAAGILPTQAVLVRLDERPVEARSVLGAWGCDLDDPGRLSPEAVIRHYALAPLPERPIGCATDPLLSITSDTRSITTRYPTELNGTSGRAVFGNAPSVAIIVYLDARERRTGFEDSRCTSARALATRGEDGAPWLQYADRAMPENRVVSWFISTEEEVSRETFVARCREVAGFPTALLDNLEPSSKVLYRPLAASLDDAGRAVSPSFCKMMVDSEFHPFVRDEVHALAELVGTEVDDEALDVILAGGVPSEVPTDVPGE